MLFKDLDVYLQVARALLAGQNPYAVPEAYYPLPFYFVFVPLAVLPVWLAHIVWTAIEIAVLVSILRRRALYALLFMPVVLALLMGQIDLPMLGVLALLQSGRFGGIALALLMLKPQLIIFLIPWQVWRWWNSARRQVALFASTLIGLGTAAFAVEPTWLQNWIGLSGERLRAPLSASLWGGLSFIPIPLYALAGIALAVGLLGWAYRRGDFPSVFTANLLVNPVIISYDLSLLTLFVRARPVWLALIAASWLSFGISAAGWWRGEGPFALTALLVLVSILWQEPGRRAGRVAPLGYPAEVAE